MVVMFTYPANVLLFNDFQKLFKDSGFVLKSAL